MSSNPAPFSSARNKLTIYKITIIYALFYTLMKIVAIFQGAWIWANLMISLPVLWIGFLAWIQLKKNTLYWWFIILSIFVISTIRYYESTWMVWINQNLS